MFHVEEAITKLMLETFSAKHRQVDGCLSATSKVADGAMRKERSELTGSLCSNRGSRHQ